MPTKHFPLVQIAKDTWEIDEFDIASCFLLIGTERALLIDCGQGVGDLRGAVEALTDKPLTVVISHSHGDHIGHAYQFDEVWINPKDIPAFGPKNVERVKSSAMKIAKRQKGCFQGVYKMFRLYPYDLEKDILPSGDKAPVIREMTDGMQFDLGGGRIVTAYDAPGHTPGEMVFMDSATRICFAGDAVNYNLGVSSCPLETTVKYLKRLESMKDQYECIYNGHHDFRALGEPLDDDCLPTAIAIMEDAVAGHIVPVEIPNWWGQDMPLTADPQPEDPNSPPKRTFLCMGRNFVGIDPNNIHE